MALQLTTQHHGVTIADAYHRVIRIGGNKNQIEVTVGVFANASEVTPFRTFSFMMPLTIDGSVMDVNPVRQAYEHLKAGPVTVPGGELDLSGAVDVI